MIKVNKAIAKRMALKEIIRLMKLALDKSTPLEYADRYVELAREFSMRYRVRIPMPYKLFICKGCKRVLRPGEVAVFRVRARPYKHIAVKCLRCGRVYRKGFSKELKRSYA